MGYKKQVIYHKDVKGIHLENPSNDFPKITDSLKGIEANNSESERNKNYDFFEPKKLKEGEIPLEEVIGHEKQKEELLRIIGWFKNYKELKEQGISYPHGVILHGPYGCGKSLIMKEIIKCAEAPVFIYQHNNNDVSAGINETFKKAREIGHAVVVFDELDLLINGDARVARALQENLDGVESDNDILVLTATNDIKDIPEALLRNGRLEKSILIPYPTGKEALEILKKCLDKYHVTFSDALDSDELEISLTRISCAGIKSIANDIVLRNGTTNITNEMIYDSLFNIVQRLIGAKTEEIFDVAVHEASHAFVASQFPQYFKLNRLNISGNYGEFHAKPVVNDTVPYKKAFADICISFAGVIGQKVICGEGSRGCEEDLESARNSAYNAVNKCGCAGCWRTLPNISNYTRPESNIKKRRNERIIERILKSCERRTTKMIVKNKDKIKELATILFEKQHLKSSEIYSILGISKPTN